jgi:hypothetical protein
MVFTPVIRHRNDGGTESMDDAGFILPRSGFVQQSHQHDLLHSAF